MRRKAPTRHIGRKRRRIGEIYNREPEKSVVEKVKSLFSKKQKDEPKNLNDRNVDDGTVVRANKGAKKRQWGR